MGRQTQIIAVFGRRGFGKTTWIRWWIDEHPEERYFIMDHFHEYHLGSDAEYVEGKVAFGGGKRIVVFRGEIEFDEIFERACEIGNVTVVFDEVDMVCSPAYVSNNLNRIIQYGRHLKVGLICASRRPANVHRNLTSQAAKIVCYNVQEPRDLKYIEDFCGQAYSERAPTLRRGEYIEYPSDDSLTVEE